MKITIFPDLSGEHPQEHATDAVDLAERIANPRTYPNKAACPLLKLATFGTHRHVNGSGKPGSLRNDDNVIEVHGVEGDYDGGQVSMHEAAAKAEAAGIHALFYTSPRHSPEAPRWRVLAPFAAPQPPEHRAAILARLNGILGGILAPESFTLSQTYYFGQVNGAPYQHAIIDGDRIDTRADLDAIAIGRPERASEPPPAGEAGPEAERVRALKFATEAALRTQRDGNRGRHREAYLLGCILKREHFADLAAILEPVLDRFITDMRPCDTHGEATPVNREALRKAIRDGYSAATAAPDVDIDALLGKREASEEGEDDAGLRPVDLSDLEHAEIAPPRYVLAPVIPRGHLTLFGGHGGTGKSILGLTWAAHIAAGRDWGPFTATAGRVLYVSMEDHDEVVRWRLRKICTAYSLPFAEVAARLRIIDATDAHPIMTEANNGGLKVLVRTATAERLEQIIDGADLVVVDNASDAYDGNENERRQVRKFVRTLTGMVRGHDGAVLLLAHIDKAAARYGASGNSYSGSTAWHNSARSRVALTEDALVHEKLNVGKKHEEPVAVVWNDDGVLMPDVSGEAKAAADALVQSIDDDAVLECLQAAADAGETVPTATTGQRTAFHILTLFPGCPQPAKRVNAALMRLASKGRVRRVSYRNASRKPAEKWEPAT